MIPPKCFAGRHNCSVVPKCDPPCCDRILAQVKSQHKSVLRYWTAHFPYLDGIMHQHYFSNSFFIRDRCLRSIHTIFGFVRNNDSVCLNLLNGIFF